MATPRIVLTPVFSTDANALFEWINDRELVRLHGPYRPVPRDEHEAWMKAAIRDGGVRQLAIRNAGSPTIIGLVQLVDPHPVHKSVELRIRIGRASDRGKGGGREAVELACRHAFGALGMERVFLHVFSDNVSAIRAYEAAGFLAEGRMRRAALIENEWKHVLVMARLRGADPEFTETGFAALISALRVGGYRFARFGERYEDKHVLWRHDVDMSLHRAVRLGAIEQEMGAKATYFLNPRSQFYNLLEPEILGLVAQLGEQGHQIGLHYDASIHAEPAASAHELETRVAAERDLLETIIGQKIEALSWHNPEHTGLIDAKGETVAGLHNAYSKGLSERYVYCSDSNGRWRHRSMHDVIAKGEPYLHLLTHPAWWTATALTAGQRSDRALIGRSLAIRRKQDELLAESGREEPDD